MKHYRVELTEAYCPAGVASAATRSCMCCGTVLCGMGGGGDYICGECIKKIASGSLLDELHDLKRRIRNFCTGYQWAVDEWKAQPHIKPLFDVNED